MKIDYISVIIQLKMQIIIIVPCVCRALNDFLIMWM